MAWIRTATDHDATPAARAELGAARARAGRVWNIVRVMTPNPDVLRAAMQFYRAVMHGLSPLRRYQRELLAVVVATRTAPSIG